MKHNIFSIYDSKAKAYLTPFFLHQDGMAIRIFTDCVNDPNHQFNKHPEDYILFNIGTWSDDKAIIKPNLHTALATGIELKKTDEDFQNIQFSELSKEEQSDFIKDWNKDHTPIGEIQ